MLSSSEFSSDAFELAKQLEVLRFEVLKPPKVFEAGTHHGLLPFSMSGIMTVSRDTGVFGAKQATSTQLY